MLARFRSGYVRQREHRLPLLRKVNTALEVLAFVFSVAVIVSLVLLSGFDAVSINKVLLKGIINWSLVVFALNVAFNFLFRIWRERIPRLNIVLDILLLIVCLTLLYPHPAHPWLPWLEKILYSNYFIAAVLAACSLVSISQGVMKMIGRHTNPALLLGGSFIVIILIGTLLLMMPRCLNPGAELSVVDALFVSTSAVSITGLCPVDVSGTFTPFGILVLSLLIEAGALGILTFTSFFAIFFAGNNSIYSQFLVRDMVYTPSMNSLLPTMRYIILFTLSVELVGAILIFACVHDTLDMSLTDELIFSGFHSLTAFCNAGFSNIEGGMSNPLLLHSNQSIYIVVSILIFAGGIGFPILVNLQRAINAYCHRLFDRLRHRSSGHVIPAHLYDLNTKIVLYTTLVVFIVSVGLFYLFESDNAMRGMSAYDKIVQSIFNSFVPRSSGFESLSVAGFMPVTLIMMMVLMWIGGASQSTAGGIKVNTLGAVILNIKSLARGHNAVTAFNRTISDSSLRRANAVVAISIFSYILFAGVMVYLEPLLPVKAVLYEAASALFTVGSSLGITAELSSATKVVACIAMFLGRVGIISLLLGLTTRDRNYGVHYPSDEIIIN